jgi:hypothetical protein
VNIKIINLIAIFEPYIKPSNIKYNKEYCSIFIKFIKIIIIPDILINGINKYPPKNNIVVAAHIKIILLYSAKKKNTNGLALYSVKNPATSSLSASTRSNGGLLVSAIVLIKKIINKGNNGIINHNIR